MAVADGTLRLAFGAISGAAWPAMPAPVHFLQLLLAAGVADTSALLLTLVWTAGFLPGFLEPHAISVLLAKPISRGGLLLGKMSACLAFVLVCRPRYFVAGTWLALAIRTGIWGRRLLVEPPLLLLHFAIFFSFSLLLTVCTREHGGFACSARLPSGDAAGRSFSAGTPVTATWDLTLQGSFSSPLVWLADICYWVLPKPVDLGRLVFDALGRGSISRPVLESTAAVSLPLAILTSLLFTGYVLLAACRQFAGTDY